jgi:hypothetical protein
LVGNLLALIRTVERQSSGQLRSRSRALSALAQIIESLRKAFACD